jgi:hypothetical protein
MNAAFDEVFATLVASGMEPARAASLLNQIALEGASAVSKRAEPTANALVRRYRERKKPRGNIVWPEFMR